MPASSSASQQDSSSSRCWGSIASASRGAMPKNSASNSAGVGEEAALAGVAGAGAVGVGVVEALEVPAAVGGELGDAVAALGDQLPELLGGADPARVAAGHADDRDRLVARLGADGDLLAGAARRSPRRAGARRARRRSGSRRRRSPPRRRPVTALEPVAQLDRGERVEAELLEGPARARPPAAEAWPSTAATSPRTRSRTKPSRSASGRAASLAASEPAAALRRLGARTRPLKIGGRAPAEARAREAGGVERHRQRQRRGRRASAASKSARPCSSESASIAGAPHPRQVGLAEAARPCRPRAPTGPRRSRSPAGLRPGAAAASASRKALAAA